MKAGCEMRLFQRVCDAFTTLDRWNESVRSSMAQEPYIAQRRVDEPPAAFWLTLVVVAAVVLAVMFFVGAPE